MNWVDIGILVLCGITLVWGAGVGITGIAFMLFASAASIALGSRLGPMVGELIVPDGDIQVFAGFLIVYVAAFIISATASYFVRRALGFLPFFGWLNRFGGAAVGLLVGLLLSFGALAGMKQIDIERIDDAIDESTLGSFVLDTFGFVGQASKLVPDDWRLQRDSRDDFPSVGRKIVPEGQSTARSAYSAGVHAGIRDGPPDAITTLLPPQVARPGPGRK